MQKRKMGRSGIEVSAIGLGTNTIGGPVWDPGVRENLPLGYGEVHQAEAVRALQRAVDLGINFFDTADEYGCGQSERLLGKALAGKRPQVVIATKFGHTFTKKNAFSPAQTPIPSTSAKPVRPV